MLTKIDDRDVSVRDIVERGYYLGSNASYNIRQMAQAGYVIQERSSHDRRSMRVRLTEKGKDLCAKIREFEDSHSKTLRGEPSAMREIESATETLRRIERTWSDYLSYQAL
jgi:DNA-binding MarR family transcriptional regulator